MAAFLRITLAMAALAVLAACGNDSDPVCGGPDLGLDGSWAGVMETDDGDLFTLEWSICGDFIAREAIGGIDVGATGVIGPAGPAAWRGVLSDGTGFRMLTSPSGRHAMLVTDYFEFAVLERGARGLPEFFFSDLDGHWRGRHAYAGWGATHRWQAWMLCGAGSCSSSDTGGVSATLDFDWLERDFGMFQGDFVDSFGTRGIAGALMSADLMFMGTYTCPYDYLGPEECTFGAFDFD